MSILYVDEIRSKDPNSSNKIDLSGTSVSIQHDEPTADIAVSVADLNTALNAAITPLILPAGMIAPFAVAAAPAGWLICDGAAISRTTYIDLYLVILETWGPGNNNSTFNIPDLRASFLRGVGTSIGYTDNTGNIVIGAVQNDAIQAHRHQLRIFTGTALYGPGYGDNYSIISNYNTLGVIDARVDANETRVKNKGVQFCIKY